MDILLYCDPSPRGDWAVTAASMFPKALAGSITLLATEEDLRANPALVASIRARLADNADSIVEIAKPGPAERAVPAAAAERRYDLVITPPAGRSALQRMLKGSRVASIMRTVATPVLVARRPPRRMGHVLVALSGGAPTADIVRYAQKVAGAAGATLSFIHVSSEVPVPGTADATPAGPIAEIERALGEAGIKRPCIVRDGLVVDEILREMDSGAYDLLVLGAPSAPAGSLWTRENVVERILLQCPSSVLIYRKRAES
jgi:nucleotide-binding universal stress UspA family protein